MPKTRDRTNYSSDLTAQQYNRVAIHLPIKKRTAPRKVSYHAILNAIFYRLKNGCIWEDLPKDFPHYKTVYHYFNLWKKTGVWDTMLEDLKAESRTRQKKRAADVADL